MPNYTITVYRAGRFTTEVAPPWLIDIHARSNVTRDWDRAIREVIGDVVSSASVEDSSWSDGQFMSWRTPGGGYYVDLSGNEGGHAEVWIPDAADWLPFVSAHVEPFLQTRAAIRQIAALDRLANAFIAYARHGDGRHIERDTGLSRIDQETDRQVAQKRQRRVHEAMAASGTVQA